MTKQLRAFFGVEIRNEDDGGTSPSTLFSANDSLEQAPDDVIEDWSEGGNREALMQEIKALVRDDDWDAELEMLL